MEEHFVINSNLPGLNPLHFGQERCQPLHFFGPGTRPYWLIHYIVSGKGIFSVRDKTYHLSSSQCFIIRPGEKVFYQADQQQPWHYIWICFRTDTELPAPFYGDTLTVPGLGSIFSAIMDGRSKSAGQAEYLSAKLWELVSIVAEAGKPRVPKNERFAERAKTCIETKYMTDLTVTKIAKMLNLERSYFSTVFRKTFGVSPQTYLSNYRLEKAAELLLADDASITDIAYATGYSGVINFSRMFKRRYHVSPSEYRAMYRKHNEE
ncbi:MAG: AraC family transcriptional regulator [Eubacteriales bacterium]|nr:AraC family transcriptional regulator [Eubacteriales bacterium]